MHLICPHCQNPIELVEAPPEIVCPSCGSSFQLEGGSTTPWGAGGKKSLGRFTLLEAVGTGAFGTVYKAKDAELDRVVAIKVPRTGNLVSRDDRDRFIREARSVAQLRHASIVSVHEVGEADGLPYLVSDFVQGVTLADLLSARRPGFRDAAGLIAVVADALQYAHGRGVVHRDVKPSNILLDDHGDPHLTDFGLAKRDAGEVTMTLDGQVLGTPAYMSPEQARGEGHRVDGRSDVYSLGVVLYQLLTGELPFRGTSRMLLHQVLHDEPRPPRSLNDRIPRDLQTVCLKAMAKEPRRRYASAAALADDLRRHLRGDPIQARPVGRVERAWRWCRRKPALAAVGGLAAAALLALVGVSVTFGLFQSRAAGDLERALNASRGHHRQSQEYSAHIALDRALELCDRGDLGEGILWLGRSLELADRAGAADLERCVRANLTAWRQEFRAPNASRSEADPVKAVAFSSDGKLLALARKDNTIDLQDRSSRRTVRTLRGHTAAVNAVAFSPDDRFVLSGSDDRSARLWDVKTGQPVGEPFLEPFPNQAAAVTLVGFVPERKGVWTRESPSPYIGYNPAPTYRVFERALDKSRRAPQPLNAAEWEFDWQGRAWPAGPGKRTRLRQTATGELLEQFDQFEFVQAGADGRRVVTARGREVRVWDLATGRPRSRPWLVEDVPTNASFSPDGKTLCISRQATVGQNVSHTFLRLWDWGPGKRVGPPYEEGISFSPDGQSAAIGGQVWDLSPLQGDVRLLVLWTQVLTQLELDENDAVRRLDEATWEGRRRELARRTARLAEGRLAGAAADRIAWLRRRAAEAEKAEKWQAAADALGQLIAKEPDPEKLLRRRGFALAKLRQWPKALADFSRVIDRQGDDGQARQLRALVYAELGQTGPALSDCARAAELAPRDGAVWLLRSLVHARAGRMPKAEADYARAARLWRTAILPPVLPPANSMWLLAEASPASWQLLADWCTRVIDGGKPEWWHWRGRGLAHAAAGKWNEALRDFSQTTSVRPGDPEGWAGYGAIMYAVGQWGYAAEALTKALDVKKEDASLWLLSARIHHQGGQADKAVAAINRAVGLKAAGWAVWQERGRLYARLGQWDKAVADFTKAIEGKAPGWAVWFERGKAHAELGRWDQADADFARAEKFPGSKAVAPEIASIRGRRHLQRGDSYLRRRDWEKALAEFRRLVTLRPDDKAARHLVHVARANLHLRRRQRDQALAELTKAIEVKADVGPTWQARGQIYLELRQWDKAVADLGRAIDLKAADQTVWYDRGRAEARLGQWAAAVADLTRAMTFRPRDPAAKQLRHYCQGRLHMDSGQWLQAASEFAAAVQSRPDDQAARQWLHRSRARVYVELGNWDEAAADFARALAFVPDSEDPWFSGAGVYYELAPWEEVFNRLVDLRPRDVKLRIARVRHFARRGDWHKAAAGLARVVQLAPSDHEVWFHYAPVKLQLGDVEGYRAACREMCTRFAGTKFPHIAERTAKTCLLLPDAVRDHRLVTRLAERAVTGTEKFATYRWFLLVRGMADYRRGRFDRAVTRLRQSLSPGPELPEPSLDAMAHLFLAMAHHRLGRPEEARRSLDAAGKIRETKFPKDPAWPWADWQRFDWLRFDIVRREAEAVLHPELAHRSRAEAHVRSGRWDQAAAEFTRATEINPEDPWSWYCQAIACLAAGDLKAYRHACAQMLERFGKSRDAFVISRLAYACVPAPDALADMSVLVPLAEKAVPAWRGNARILGAALYRANKPAAALLQFRQSAKDGFVPRAWDWLFLALIHHRLGDAQEARRCMGKAVRWIEEAERPAEPSQTKKRAVWGHWTEQREVEALRHEAEALVLRKPVKPKSGGSP